MNTMLAFRTVVEPALSVYMPVMLHRPIAFHDDVNGETWAQYGNGYAFPRSVRGALYQARQQMEEMQKKEEA